MKHQEHVNLIRTAHIKNRGVWADLGSGEGAFTLALRDLAGENVEIYSIDRDEQRLQEQEKIFNITFPKTAIHFLIQDFTQSLELPPLDGIIMANSLHYVKDHVSYLKKVYSYLKPQGTLVLVEYSIDEGNQWVPYPLSFPTLEKEASSAGFTNIKLLERIPSSYWGEMYSAIAKKP